MLMYFHFMIFLFVFQGFCARHHISSVLNNIPVCIVDFFSHLFGFITVRLGKNLRPSLRPLIPAHNYLNTNKSLRNFRTTCCNIIISQDHRNIDWQL
ncbi:hypothetical protein F5890DRAFT_302086 [Lentinula detonsa]|uniref:Secreted protein n=1 Tax=Lentinula detonsa TaxID=2804962 RepID=A0AA38URP4_9AGAR|nr:hypothetical protein F5890DRAFT_302086 [Lentinula detonsa]